MSKVEAKTIHVNSGPFGGGVVPLVVTKGTRIMVGTKKGWFEDIRPGGQVKVAYEFHQGRRFARSVELLVDRAPAGPTRCERPLKGGAGDASLVERVPAKMTGAPTPEERPAGGTQIVGAEPAPKPAGAVSKPVSPMPGQPAPPAEPTPAPRAQRAATTAPARNAPRVESLSRVVDSPRPVDLPRALAPAGRPEPASGSDSGEASDGSAAVDWLLRTHR